VQDIQNSVLMRDTIQRHAIRSPEMLGRVVAFVLDNVGGIFSANGVANYFKSQRRRVDPETVYSYLNALEQAFLIARVPRFDLRGKEWLKTQEKYYVADHSLINAAFGYSEARLPGILENIVWAELRRRGFRVGIGLIDSGEVDFVATRQSDRVYIQVTYQMAGSDETRRREYAPLEAIRDSYPKYIVSLDPVAGSTDRGIRHLRLPDFLQLEAW
jgi:predicted AAA+ superfamily ATPase